MTPQERKVFELALEALEISDEFVPVQEAITAIKEALAQPEREPDGYVQTVIDALYENSDPVSVEAAELLERMTQPEQKPVAWVNWCAATGKRSVSFECESELASQPLYTKEQS